MNDFEKRIAELSPEKRELLDIFLGEGDINAVWLQSDYVAPRTSVEELLATVWQDVLGVERIGINDNLFEIGGDSLHCIQIVARCREAGVQLTVNDLFERPTITKLSAIAISQEPITDSIRNQDVYIGIDAAELESVSQQFPTHHIEDVYPLSPMQEGMLFQALSSPGSGVYFEQGVCTLRGPLDISVFEQAWKEVVERHPVLRTAFAWEGVSKPIQIVCKNVVLPVEHQDWRHLSISEQEINLKLYLETNRERGVDLKKPPLMRLTFIRLADDVHQVIWGIHHLVHDAWATFAILREVLTIYESRHTGQLVALKPARPYKDFIAWLNGQSLSEAETFWRKTLGGFTTPTSLTTDYQGQDAQSKKQYDRQEGRLNAADSAALNLFARQNQITLNTLILGAWTLLLSRYSDKADVVFGVVVSGRFIDLPGAESIVGPMFNTLPFRASLSPDESLKAWLKNLQSRQLEIQRHEQTPLRKILEWSDMRAGSPLFDNVLIFQNVFGDISGNHSDLQMDNVKSLGYSNIPLSVRVTPRAELWTEILYDSGRFSATWISVLIEDLNSLLSRMMADPDAEMRTFISQSAPAKPVTKTTSSPKAFMKKPGELQPKVIRFSTEELVKTHCLEADNSFPLVLEPAVKDLDAAGWIAENHDYIEDNLLKHGALLFRRFETHSVSDFERFIKAVSPDLLEYRERSTPRTQLGGNIYTSTEYPAHQNIAYHNEFSYAYTWPMKICFHCVQPAIQGGETPIADSRKVFRLIPPSIRNRFIEKGVMYVRNYGTGIDLTWEEAFQTTDRAVVEEYCRNAPMEFEWRDNNRLRTKQIRPAVMNHSKTGEMVWFNQAHLFHVSNLGGEVRRSMIASFKEDDLTRNAFYGDGSSLEDEVMDEIRAAYDQSSVSFPWRNGDVLLLDNMLMAHGRKSFIGPRKIVVAMAEPFTLSAEDSSRG